MGFWTLLTWQDQLGLHLGTAMAAKPGWRKTPNLKFEDYLYTKDVNTICVRVCIYIYIYIYIYTIIYDMQIYLWSYKLDFFWFNGIDWFLTRHYGCTGFWVLVHHQSLGGSLMLLTSSTLVFLQLWARPVTTYQNDSLILMPNVSNSTEFRKCIHCQSDANRHHSPNGICPWDLSPSCFSSEAVG